MKQLTIIGALMLAACAGANGSRVVAAASPLAPDANASERLVAALTDAQEAMATGDPLALGAALAAIEGLGGRPAGEEEQRLLDGWKAVAPAQSPTRGRLRGPAFRSGTIAPGASMTIEQAFLAGQKAEVAVEATGAEIALSIADESETLCSRSGARASCTWVPIFTRRHAIRIVNRGGQPARYHLAMN